MFCKNLHQTTFRSRVMSSRFADVVQDLKGLEHIGKISKDRIVWCNVKPGYSNMFYCLIAQKLTSCWLELLIDQLIDGSTVHSSLQVNSAFRSDLDDGTSSSGVILSLAFLGFVLWVISMLFLQYFFYSAVCQRSAVIHNSLNLD